MDLIIHISGVVSISVLILQGKKDNFDPQQFYIFIIFILNLHFYH